MPPKVSLIQDISDKHALSTLIPAAAVVALYDEHFTIVEANSAYFNLTGYSREETRTLFKNKGLETLHPDDLQLALFSLQHQIERSEENIFNVVSRLVNKKNKYKNIHFSGTIFTDDDGLQKVFILLIDITSQIKLFEGLEKEKRFNNLIDNLTDDTFFEYNVDSKEIRFSKHFAEKFAINEVSQNFPKSFIDAGIIESNFIDFNSTPKDDSDDIHVGEVSLVAPDGTEWWFSTYYKIETNINHQPIRVIGKMNDITSHKEKMGLLREKAERDHLTSLYNKATTEALIDKTLRENKANEKFALMIIDVDNFKSVNDKLGHLFGDIVLAQLAEHLSQQFRSNDIIGRIGGDEFFVFICHMPSRELIIKKAENICEAFNKTFHEGNISVEISASIGIALCPEHGKEFESLYKNADIALYSAKEKGKNRFEFYEGGEHTHYQSTRTEIETKESVVTSFLSNRVEYIFRLLFTSEYAFDALKTTLGLILEHFKFSSAYIGELDDSGMFFINSFEYDKTDTTNAEKNEKIYHKISMKNLQYFRSIITEGRIYDSRKFKKYPKEVLKYFKSRNIKSMLVYPILKDKKPLGYVVFENANTESQLKKNEFDELSTICNILATFYIKDYLIKQAKEKENLLAELINNLDGYSYIIDKDNYTILYETPSLEKTFGGSNLGNICYQVYTGSDEPCKHCFIPFLTDENPQYKRLNMTEALGMGQAVKASLHNWTSNQKACLVNCVDISDFFSVKKENKD